MQVSDSFQPQIEIKEAMSSVPSYILLTAAHNEADFIARTIESIASQTILPKRWIIASDGSTDATDEIVDRFCGHHSFIRLLRVDQSQPRGVIRKVNALAMAFKGMQDVPFKFVGNLDADVSLDSRYFETLLERFAANQALGISGGLIYEKGKGGFEERISNRTSSVAHAAQLVRRECFEAIGGYVAMRYGGEDWFAEVSARMKGWQVHAFPDLKVMHHRATGAVDHMLQHCLRQGRMDFSMGSHVLFEILKCVRRIPERPVLLGAGARWAGFCEGYVKQQPRLVPPEFSRFLRNEQMSRLKRLFGIPVRTEPSERIESPECCSLRQ
jgi:glycosyltransferase involved in cell wall biosynthesis